MSMRNYVGLGFALLCGSAVAAPYNTNLLQNPGAETGDLSGWTILANGGDGWAVLGSPGSRIFTTSYHDSHGSPNLDASDVRCQEIDLLAAGFSTADLDAAPDIQVGEWFQTWMPYTARYFISVEVRDENHQAIASWNVGTRQSPVEIENVPWFEQSHTFTSYGAGARYVYFEDGGDDEPHHWAGPFGAQFDLANVSVVPEPTVVGGVLAAACGLMIRKRQKRA